MIDNPNSSTVAQAARDAEPEGRAAPASAPVITVVEPEALAPLGRLSEWLFAEGAVLRMVRPWSGDAIPDLSEIGSGLVVLGGAMSAHDDARSSRREQRNQPSRLTRSRRARPTAPQERARAPARRSSRNPFAKPQP